MSAQHQPKPGIALHKFGNVGHTSVQKKIQDYYLPSHNDVSTRNMATCFDLIPCWIS